MRISSHRRGQSMPINVIIIAVIALAVLVVLLFIFGGKFKIFSKTVDKSCPELGGEPANKVTEGGSESFNCEGKPPILMYLSKSGGGAPKASDGTYACCVPVGAG